MHRPIAARGLADLGDKLRRRLGLRSLPNNLGNLSFKEKQP